MNCEKHSLIIVALVLVCIQQTTAKISVDVPATLVRLKQNVDGKFFLVNQGSICKCSLMTSVIIERHRGADVFAECMARNYRRDCRVRHFLLLLVDSGGVLLFVRHVLQSQEG